MDEVNFEKDSQPTVANSDLATITKVAEDLKAKKEYVAKLTEKLESYKKIIHEIESGTLPTLMQAAGMSSFSLQDGKQVKIKPIYNASIPSKSAIDKASEEDRAILIEKRDKAFAYLVENNAESIIKNNVTAALPAGSTKEAEEAIKVLADIGVEAKTEKSVHPQTLNSHVKQMIEAGKQIDLEVLSVYTGHKAEIK